MLDFEFVKEHKHRATKKDQRKGWSSLGRKHNAMQQFFVSQKQQLCIRFKVIYCLAVGRLKYGFKHCTLALLDEYSILGRLQQQRGYIPALYLSEINQGTN